ncbi:hypothetical protein [Azospirillum largimobile]
MAEPLNTIAVLCDEAKAIHGANALGDLPEPPNPSHAGCQEMKEFGRKVSARLGKLDQTALCLSGGGIRSASFALGIIQALASWPSRNERHQKTCVPPPDTRQALLGQFDYLSTVSGGGYIGSWLSAWLTRDGFNKVLPALHSRDGAIGGVEPPQINDLRRYSNYLTPKVGLLSADSWAAAAMMVRNLLLNWTLLLPLFLLSIVFVKLLVVGVTAPATVGGSGQPWFGRGWTWGIGLLTAILAAYALSLSQRLHFNHAAEDDRRTDESFSQKQFIRRSLLPALSAGLLWTAILDSRYLAGILPADCCSASVDPQFPVVLGAAVGIAIFGAARLYGRSRSGQYAEARPRIGDLRNLKSWGWLVAGACYGAFIGFGANVLAPAFDPVSNRPDPQQQILLVLFGLPWFLMSQMAAESVYIALTSSETRTDEQREWFARSAGWFIALSVFWILGTALIILGSFALALAQADWSMPIELSAVGAAISTVVGWLAGASRRTPAKGAAKSLTGKIYSALAMVAAALFFGFLVVLGSAWTDWVALNAPLIGFPLDWFVFLRVAPVEADPCCSVTSYPGAILHLVILAVILVAVAWFASRFVNINRFSLHGLYRNRLVRAFLGPSHPGRKPDRFTGFDMDDNIHMSKLWETGATRHKGDDWRPFHILNLTLNMVSSRELAWQQRKAMSFTVSPLHSGAAGLHPRPKTDGVARSLYLGAYQSSRTYGGANGITLGTAMAISGAAVNPNMGYHSSPVVSLLLTLLNVRLGWWLGNPGEKGADTWEQSGPPYAAGPIINEAFGLTTEALSYVNLSDGGHFENLGLYEMVRRRCRYIVVSDAGCDAEFAFEDLGNAVRKVEIDFGIPIRFIRLQDLKPRPAEPEVSLPNTPYHSIGIVDYPAVDGKDAECGIILYVKASFHNCNESAGVKAYAKAHPDFPHEPTSDQWFDEAQFESYRSLGFEIMTMILNRAAGPCNVVQPGQHDLKSLLKVLCDEAIRSTPCGAQDDKKENSEE